MTAIRENLATKVDIAELKEKLDARAEAIRELGKMMRWMFGITVALLVAVVASMAGALVLLFLG